VYLLRVVVAEGAAPKANIPIVELLVADPAYELELAAAAVPFVSLA
jgi:hypothetical protein